MNEENQIPTNLYPVPYHTHNAADSPRVKAKELQDGEQVVTLTDGATVAINAYAGLEFVLVAAGNRTILAPTNPTDFKKIVIRHKASGADRTLSLTTGAGGFRFGTDITGLTATTSALTDYILAIYNLTDNRWDVVAYVKGY